LDSSRFRSESSYRARSRCHFWCVPRASENSPAIHGWVHGWPTAPVPAGTAETFFRPGRDLMEAWTLIFRVALFPAINGWAIVGDSIPVRGDGLPTSGRCQPSNRLFDRFLDKNSLSTPKLAFFIQPTGQLVQSTDQLAQSADQLVQSTDQLVQPSDQLAQSTDQLVQSSDQLAQSTDQLVHPSDRLVQVSVPMAQSTDQLAEAEDLMAQASVPMVRLLLYRVSVLLPLVQVSIF